MASSNPPKPFGVVPQNAKQNPKPFELHFKQQDIDGLKTLIRLSPVAKETYENRQQDRRFGVTREWMQNAKQYWQNEFNWKKHENHINSFPNYKSEVTDDDGTTFSVHFAALFSEKPGAVPIAFFHGWPGSFLEFLPIMDILRKKYAPKDLPYHIIAPSLLGYTLSEQPPLDRDWKIADTARIMHKLLLSLGFGEMGYVVQGGDIGSFISRTIAATYPECKAMHLNMMYMHPPADASSLEAQLTEQEKEGQDIFTQFQSTGNAYGRMHGTRPATIGHVLASSPIALLAWIGEKFLAWTDDDLPLDTVLADVTLYWLTSCYPTSIYTYREDFSSQDPGYFHAQKRLHVDKPFGYSYFPAEITPIPKAWAERTGNLVFFNKHQVGGHFAALERPQELWGDVEEFVGMVWKE